MTTDNNENIDNENSSQENITSKGSGKSAKKNYLFNLAYQIFSLIVPLIVTPYTSRILTSEGIGKYSFAMSLIMYFTLFGSLGFSYYAQRAIAKYQGDAKTQSKIFWEINICRLLPVSIALITNVILCMTNVYGDYTFLMWVFSINVAALAFDISFFYQGNEEFGKLLVRNLIINISSIVAIFLLVKKSSDLWIYALINSSAVLLSGAVMWVFGSKHLVRVDIKSLRPFSHLKGTLILFLPTIAVSIYTILDKTLIGVIISGETTQTLSDGTVKIIKNSDLQNGYYEQAEKMVKMTLTVLTSLGVVMVPRNSFYFQTKNYDQARENIYKAIDFVIFLGIPLMFGIMGVAFNFSPWFFGEGYEEDPYVILALAPLILAIGFNNIFGIQYLIPIGKDFIYTISVIIGAVSNLVLNLVLIPFFGARGAAIASVIAESAILLFQMIYSRHFFSYKRFIFPFIRNLLIGGAMFVGVFLLSKYVFAPSIPNTLLLIVIGASFYMLMLLIVRDKFLFYILSLLKNKILAIKGKAKKE